MEGLTAAACLRMRARDAMLAGGGRGFMRFLPPGGALMVTDANRRCETDKLTAALGAAGFACAERGGLLELTPTDAMLKELAGEAEMDASAAQIDWESPGHPAQALARRWLRAPQLAWTDAGRQLVIETIRLLWQGEFAALAGLDALCARAAVMLRTGDRSGMREAGIFLLSIQDGGLRACPRERSGKDEA